MFSTVDDYGARWLKQHTGGKLADFKASLDFFRAGLKEYFYSHAAGHCRLDVSDDAVTVAFYPGDAREAAWTRSLL